MHVEHVHCPPAGFGGGLIPAAAQLKPCAASAGLGLDTRGASHTMHLSPDVVFVSMHSEHVHELSAGFEGSAIPAALQPNPPVGLVAAAAAGPGTGAGVFPKS